MPVCAIRPNSYASAGYLILQSIPLLFFPRILLLLSTPRGAVGQAGGEDADASATSRLGPTLTPIEQFTSFSWGLSMITLALTTIIQVSWNKVICFNRGPPAYPPLCTHRLLDRPVPSP